MTCTTDRIDSQAIHIDLYIMTLPITLRQSNRNFYNKTPTPFIFLMTWSILIEINKTLLRVDVSKLTLLQNINKTLFTG